MIRLFLFTGFVSTIFLLLFEGLRLLPLFLEGKFILYILLIVFTLLFYLKVLERFGLLRSWLA
jgi:hypothetical protein